MNKIQNRLGDNYKWFVLVGCSMVLMCYFGIVNNIYSIYIIPVCDDLGFSRSQFSLIQSLYYAFVMIMSFFSPKVFARFGILKTLRFSCISISVLYFLYGCVSDLVSFYIIGMIIGVLMGLNCTVPTAYITKQWFDKNVGFWIGLSSSMSGLGAIFFNQIAKNILLAADWRTLYKTMAVIMGVLGFIATFVLLKEKSNKSREGNSVANSGSIYKTKEIVDWKIAVPVMVSLAFVSFAQQSVIYTATPFMQDIGYSLKYAANVASIMMGTFAIGKMVYGCIIDHIGMRFTETLSGITVFLGSVGFIFYPKLGTIMLPLLALSAAFGSPVSNVGAAMLPDFTSPNYRNRATGLFVAAVNCGGCFVPVVSNTIYDKTGSYIPLFYCVGLFCIIQIVIINCVFKALKKNAH